MVALGVGEVATLAEAVEVVEDDLWSKQAAIQQDGERAVSVVVEG